MSVQDSSLEFSKYLKHLPAQTHKRSLCLGQVHSEVAFLEESSGMMVIVFCDAF